MTIEKMRREVVAPRRSTDEWKVRAERDALIAEAARLTAGEGGSSCEGSSIESADVRARSPLRHASSFVVSPNFNPVETPKIR